ncbi:MAG TPA: NAD-dependent succinate-semialdehyde dehydrogenase [Edaphocola sp.]|nr:NAD-dependent succinate-semialdehyde dehydrogenase [Edaphocola sp.]
MLSSINPYTNLQIAQYPELEKKEVENKITSSHQAFEQWKNLSIKERAAYLSKLAEYINTHKQTMGQIATDEMGKPISQAIAELEKCAFTLQYYAENAASMLKEEKVKMENGMAYICYEPLGIVLAIMPWNFPYWQVFRAMGPILVSGNTMLLKHASNVTGCGYAIQKAMDECGFPKGVFEFLPLSSKAIDTVIAHPFVQALTFTGSTEAGKKVAGIAASHLKKQVLELGGSDAYVILKDADLQAAAAICAESRLNNSGQSCIAAKRMIVEEAVAPHFERLLMEAFEQKPFGDPSRMDTQVGTMARADLRTALHRQVEDSVTKGAQILCGGYIPSGDAIFYPPTILTKVSKGMSAYDEELFGPVASIIIAQDEAEALHIANDTEYGLGGAVFTSDLKKGKELAAKNLDAGSVFVNTMVHSNAKLPFGGIKNSGYGRELGYYAIREFVNIKTVLVAE